MLCLSLRSLFRMRVKLEVKLRSSFQTVRLAHIANMPTQIAVRDFISSSKSRLLKILEDESLRERTVMVMGNQSADLDSLASAITFAYTENSKRFDEDIVLVPLLNIPAEDVALRQEFAVLLEAVGIDPSSIPTIDLIPPGLLPRLKWFLVDHNGPREDIVNQKRSNIFGIIDHHADEEEGGLILNPGWPEIIDLTGSCGSLVVEQTGYDKSLWPTDLACVALGPILIDTNNLKSSKTTDIDREAANFLADILGHSPHTGESRIGHAPGSQSSEAIMRGLYETLDRAKHDLEKLSVEQVLRKDYKEWSVSSGADRSLQTGVKFGISSVVKSLSWLDTKAQQEKEKDVVNVGIAYGKVRQGLDLFVVNASSHDGDGKHRRELHVFDFYGKYSDRIIRDAGGELGLKGHPTTEPLDQGPGLHFAAPIGPKMSRKATAPFLRKIIEGSLEEKQG